MHRENTLASFQAARDAGLDGVELDVRRCADGTLVVHHDAALFDGRPIAQLLAHELRPHPVPTLPEVLSWAADTGAYLNVEIKYESSWPDDRVEQTATLLQQFGLQQRCIVSSFNPLILAALRQKAPSIERGFLFYKPYQWGALDGPVAVGRVLDVSALHPHWRLVTPILMTSARRHGWRVNTWTVNEEQEAARLIGLGVDALIGDLPRVLLGAAGRHLN